MFSRFVNALDYPLRQFIRWQRPGFRLRNEDKGDPFSFLAQDERAEAEREAGRLRDQYHLDFLFEHSTCRNYRENLYYLRLLETALEETFPQQAEPFSETLLAADIGVSHWFYVQALTAFLRYWRTEQPRNPVLDGYETDAYRVYADFYSRADHAAVHMLGCEGARFIPDAFQVKAGAYDLVSLFFPFVFLTDHLTWGLPAGNFQPRGLLMDAWESVKPGGILLVVNQGLKEHRQQKAEFQRSGIPIYCEREFTCDFFSYDIERYILTGIRR